MDPATIITLVSVGLAALKQAIEVGKAISPQVVTLFNAIMEMVSGAADETSVVRLREAISAVNDELIELEDALLNGDGVGDAV